MKLSKALGTVPIFCLMAMAALADDATMPPPGGAAAACKQDVQTLCPGIQPGGGRIVACLKSHAEQVSPDCKAAIKAARGRHGHQPPGSEPPAEGLTSN
jgi:Cysteine rich repeat